MPIDNKLIGSSNTQSNQYETVIDCKYNQQLSKSQENYKLIYPNVNGRHTSIKKIILLK